MMNNKQKPSFSQTSQSGFTIIESLVAIMVVSILLISIAPVIVLSAATRLQAKRIERASEAARGYINSVQADALLDPPISDATQINAVPAPTVGALSCPGDDYCTAPAAPAANYNLYCFDNDGGGCNSMMDMVVQAFGYNPTATDPDNNINALKGYELGIRVYRADGFSETALVTQAQRGSRQVAATGGLGDRQSPLVEMTTVITPGKPTSENIRDRICGGPCPTPSPSP
ncbi:MAG: hormogonium polysaccharide secretion pseudopilin HpsB [Coleofasciculaceae cyanobacterium]